MTTETTDKVYVFAGDKVDALAWAQSKKLELSQWVWVKNPETLRRIFRGYYVILKGFERHPDCEYLIKLIALREMKRLGS